MFSEAVLKSLAQRIDSHHSLRHDPKCKALAYGTAGFRTIGELLPPVAARVVAIAILRAWFCGSLQAVENCTATCSVGFMITASHNRAADNGFKIIDTDGGMLAASWEHWCTDAANAATGAELVAVLHKCIDAADVRQPPEFKSPCGIVLIGRDTRESGIAIEAAVVDILRDVLHVPFTSFGILTTPQMHFLVAKANEPDLIAEHVRLETYYEQILSSFEELFTYQTSVRHSGVSPPQRVVVDCANGVGACGMRQLLTYSQFRSKGDVLSQAFSVALVNDSTDNPAVLNESCGADYAKQHAIPSEKMQQWPHLDRGASDGLETHFYCLDGDADRVVAFLHGGCDNDNWVLLDGDRIAILYAMLFHKWLGQEQLKELDVGVVQTAYANGASTEFIRSKLRIPVYIAATGVKNLHPVAHARDIGVYFEANGHGTVLFSDKLVNASSAGRFAQVAPLIHNLRCLLSQVCGDAICDILMCEVALRALEMTFQDWVALYTDRPCKQTKVSVRHPKLITNTPDEQRALSPQGMQEEIDTAVSTALLKCDAARSFVRPSGTEPVVRVYAEASDAAACELLSAEVCSIAQKYCN